MQKKNDPISEHQAQPRQNLALWRSCSYERNVDRQFIKTLVSAALASLTRYKNGELNINVYNPPFNKRPSIRGVSYDPGHLSLTFVEDGGTGFSELDVIFSLYENGDFIRRGLTEADQELLADTAGAVEIVAYNFDEAWQIICQIAAELNMKRISISCGGA